MKGADRSPLVPPGYKQTEVGVIPEDWDSKSVGEIAFITSGGTPNRKNPAFWGGDIPWITTALIDGTVIHCADEYITDHGVKGSATKWMEPSTLLMAMYGQGKTRGKVGMLGIRATINQACAAIVVKDTLNPKFLLHYLSGQYVAIRELSNAGGQENISSGIIRSFLVPCPPQSEQIAIATALSDVDALLEGLDRLIAKKRDLKQAAMQQLLTGEIRLPGFEGEWEVKRLGDHVRFLRNGVNSRAELTSGGPVRYLHYGDIHACDVPTLSPANLPSLPSIKAKTLDRLVDGDLVFADASEDLEGVGKSVEIYDASGMELVSGLHTIAVRFDKNVLSNGFKSYLQFCPKFARQLRRLAAGTKVYATNRGNIANVEMQLPGIGEQTAIATVLSDMDAEIEALEQRRAKTRNLKQAMMQELLTGKTRLI